MLEQRMILEFAQAHGISYSMVLANFQRRGVLAPTSPEAEQMAPCGVQSSKPRETRKANIVVRVSIGTREQEREAIDPAVYDT